MIRPRSRLLLIGLAVFVSAAVACASAERAETLCNDFANADADRYADALELAAADLEAELADLPGLIIVATGIVDRPDTPRVIRGRPIGVLVTIDSTTLTEFPDTIDEVPTVHLGCNVGVVQGSPPPVNTPVPG